MKISILEDLSKESLKKIKKIEQPEFIEPMLAMLTNNYFSSKDWIYEHKFDGERCLAYKKKGKVRLISRTNKIMNKSYPELVESLEKQKEDNFIIDGEIVTLVNNVSSFELLQKRMNRISHVKEIETTVPIYYRIFDVVYADGYDLRNVPLFERKHILKKLLEYNKILTFTDFKSPDGLLYYKEACKSHWEGLIAKKSDSTYVGVRSSNWLKFKCVLDQEFVIGGYTDPQGSRTDFGSLLIGYYKEGRLHYAGKVGTGYSKETLSLLGKKLRALETKKCPFSNYVGSTEGIHWVKPLLVAEIKFAEWTKANKLRAPRYKGLRDDKNPLDVVQELPKP